MRIAILSTPHVPTPPAGYGASETIAGHLVRGLVARGHEVRLFGVEGSSGTSDVRSFPESAQGVTFDQRELIHACRALGDVSDCDIVHNHCVAAGPMMAHLSRRPMLTTLHYKHHLLRVFPDAGYVAVSKSQAANLRSELPALRIAGTVYNGIDLREFAISSHRGPYVVFLGRFHPNKGADLAIEAANILGVRLVIAAPGPPPDQVAWFEQNVAPRLGGHVEWIGPVEGMERSRLLSEAIATLVPLRWDEPFGLVIVESMAAGTPPIVFRRGAAPELVVDGVTGFLVDEVEQMAAAVERCSAIDPLTCRAHVAQNFSVDQMVEAYLRLYDDYLMSA
jgi:glycosyltransferase involved in cell wall biosynthesis